MYKEIENRILDSIVVINRAQNKLLNKSFWKDLKNLIEKECESNLEFRIAYQTYMEVTNFLNELELEYRGFSGVNFDLQIYKGNVVLITGEAINSDKDVIIFQGYQKDEFEDNFKLYIDDYLGDKKFQ